MAAATSFLVLAMAPTANATAPSEWIVGTTSGIRSASATPGSQISPGIRVVRGDRATLRRLRRRPDVRFVEPNRHFEPSSLAAPTDRFFGQQWALRDARVPRAWRTSIGGEVTVAVLDTGIDASHPDLAGNLWTNPGEIAANGVDDDGNGFVDDVHGADMVNADGDPADGVGHGTAVAGVIGGRGDNIKGISGVDWRVRLMPVKVLPDEGYGTTATLVAGLRYALSNGARVVNMSLNGADRSLALEEAIAAAEAQGVLVVTSAGNDGADRDSVPSYPASINSAAIMSVASSARGGRLGYASAYGTKSVDIAAPGDNILTTDLRGRYGSHSGTSFAAAYVSGAAALLASARPAASGSQLRGALLASARRGGRLDQRVSGGQLDVAGAMKRLVRRARR
ncbi:MAG TPA: S8 family peptidase [Thermoleophilaceae bacterium]|nr:S8 family peptidase [Thermoleophilaceae bacterium]